MNLFEIRQLYGGTYVTVFPDGLAIPWKPLSVGEYVKYTQEHMRGAMLTAIIEDEIFRKCVIDPAIVRNMSYYKAGTVTTVVRNIWEYSGASSIDKLNQDADSARGSLIAPGVRAFHDMVLLISNAFPYTPEQIYALDYETFMLRFAMAERKLLEMGALKKPLEFEDLSKKNVKRAKRDQQVQEFLEQNTPPKEKVDAKKLWDEQQEAVKKPKRKTAKLNQNIQEETLPTDKRKWWKLSPILESPSVHDIDFRTESQEQTVFGMTGHEQQDAHIERVKMLQDAEIIYKDVIEALEKKRAAKRSK
jgi:hypothetical protein